MKRIIILAIVTTILLTGCATATYADTETPIFKTLYRDGDYRIICDTESGVHYVVYSDYRKGGITPRLDADGNVVVQYRITESGKPR